MGALDVVPRRFATRVIGLMALLLPLAVVAPDARGEVPVPVVAAEDDGASSSAVLVPTAVAADDAVVRQILLDQRVDSEPSRPGFGGYLRDVGMAVGRVLSRWLLKLAPGFASTSRWLAGLDPAWVWLAILLLGAFVLVRWLVSRERRRTVTSDIPEEALPDAKPRPRAEQDWGAAIESALAAGDAMGALEGVWWWLADRLGHERADSAWTSRELVLRAQRRDLLPMVRRFDGLVYGPRRPDPAAVRGFWDDLRGVVP